jgi:hypothetical protein
MLRTILAVQISNSYPSNVKSKPFIDYMPRDYPAFAACQDLRFRWEGSMQLLTLVKSLLNRTMF